MHVHSSAPPKSLISAEQSHCNDGLTGDTAGCCCYLRAQATLPSHTLSSCFLVFISEPLQMSNYDTDTFLTREQKNSNVKSDNMQQCLSNP